jgi:flavin-dependent dehydrogenase
MVLDAGSKVAVIGGGPSGSFFAIHLLQQAKQANRDIAVTIIEKNSAPEHNKMPKRHQHCNYCAGVISPRLHDRMKQIGIRLPRELICEEYTHIWMHGLWKNFPVRIPPGQRLYSVFRGTLPLNGEDHLSGFDSFLLSKAMEAGANVVAGEVMDIQYTYSQKPLLTVCAASGEKFTIESDFSLIATGINPNAGIVFRKHRLFKSYQKINPRYRAPKVRRTLIFELKPGRAYIKKYMDREIYYIESGSKALHLDHIALVPKGEYLTVALVGECIDNASLRQDTENIIDDFLSLPQIKMILPHLTLKNAPVSCICRPYMAVGSSQMPYGERIAVVGDAFGARLYKDGLYSAMVASQALAETVIHKGIDKISLSEGYGSAVKWLKQDIRYGRLLFASIQMAFRSPLLSRIIYQTFATEMKFREMKKWPLGNVLRKIGTSTTDYEKVARELFTAPVICSVLTGTYKTLRNILTEYLFGIRWGEYGRYPTVIVQEKRGYFKKSISMPLQIKLDADPEMERMYAIKIRASAAEIFEELGKFGAADSKFLRLRFVDVKRITGLPNHEGAVIRYSSKALPVSMDIRLVRCLPGQSLLYDPEELFFKNGILIFDVTPTKDGNHRLVIYTAFDYKRGKGLFGKSFWKLFKILFPDYAHDVVWNHAICCIKGEVEQKAAYSNSPVPQQHPSKNKRLTTNC